MHESGANLPATEIASAAVANRKRAVALNIASLGDDPTLAEGLRFIRKFLPAKITLVTGGRAAEHHATALAAI